MYPLSGTMRAEKAAARPSTLSWVKASWNGTIVHIGANLDLVAGLMVPAQESTAAKM
jgi:hypothetical protein